MQIYVLFFISRIKSALNCSFLLFDTSVIACIDIKVRYSALVEKTCILHFLHFVCTILKFIQLNINVLYSKCR